MENSLEEQNGNTKGANDTSTKAVGAETNGIILTGNVKHK